MAPEMLARGGRRDQRRGPPPAPPVALAAGVALLLFLVWSNSFIAVEFLVAGDAPRLDWLSLAVARFLPAAAICWGYLLVRRRREAIALARASPWRLTACAAVAVPLYNFALGFGQQSGVPASIASLTTTLAPLFILILALLVLGERPDRRWWLAMALAAIGMAVIGRARQGGEAVPYTAALLITAGAPLSWAIYSVLSKPIAGRGSPLVWSYLATGLGGCMLLPLLPGEVWSRWSALDAAGWGALLYLSLPCTVLGFALWTWLLRHLPAILVGLTVFLNPPLTTLSKFVLSAIAPERFEFTITGAEWVGGAIVLIGLAAGLRPWRAARSP